MKTLAVDPGIRGCGCALFDDATLTKAAYVANPIRYGNDPWASAACAEAVSQWVGDVDTLLVEYPKVYPQAQQKGDQNDLFALAAIDAVLAYLYPAGKWFYPRDWKGTANADMMTCRIAGCAFVKCGGVHTPSLPGRLTVRELNCIVRGSESLLHNTIDAIGLGLHHVGRLAPKKVIHR